MLGMTGSVNKILDIIIFFCELNEDDFVFEIN